MKIKKPRKSNLNKGTKKSKKSEVQLKLKYPFFLCPYFSKLIFIAINPPNYYIVVSTQGKFHLLCLYLQNKR